MLPNCRVEIKYSIRPFLGREELFLVVCVKDCWKVFAIQLCPTLCNLMDRSPPGSSVHGIFQARIVEWAAIPFSRGYYRPRNRTYISRIAGSFFVIWAIRLGLHQVTSWGTSLVKVQWWRSRVSNAGGSGSIPGPGTKTPTCDVAHPKKKKKKNNNLGNVSSPNPMGGLHTGVGQGNSGISELSKERYTSRWQEHKGF